MYLKSCCCHIHLPFVHPSSSQLHELDLSITHTWINECRNSPSGSFSYFSVFQQSSCFHRGITVYCSQYWSLVYMLCVGGLYNATVCWVIYSYGSIPTSEMTEWWHNNFGHVSVTYGRPTPRKKLYMHHHWTMFTNTLNTYFHQFSPRVLSTETAIFLFIRTLYFTA